MIDVAGDVTIVHAVGETAIYSLTSNESIDWSGGSLSLNASSTFFGQFNNSGTVNVDSGTLALGGGGTSSGAFESAAGATLRFGYDGFGGTHVLSGASSISVAGHVVFRQSNVTVGGSYNITGGTFQIDGGIVDFTGTVAAVGQTLHVNGGGGGRMDFHGANLTVSRLEMIDGSLFADDITVGDQFLWKQGTVRGSGTLTVLENGAAAADFVLASITVGGNQWTLADGKTLALAGQSGVDPLIPANHAFFRLQDGARIVNSGDFVVDTPINIYFESTGSAGASFANTITGRLTKANPNSGVAFLSGVAFDNSGTVELQSGTLAFGSFIQTAGTTFLNGGAISAPTLDIQGGSLTGAGTVFANVVRAGQVSPGVVSDVTKIVTVQGNYQQLEAGSLSLDLDALVPCTGHDQLDVRGVVTLAGALDLQWASLRN